MKLLRFRPDRFRLLVVVLGLLGAGQVAAAEVGSGIYAADCSDASSRAVVEIFGNQTAEVFIKGMQFENLQVSSAFPGSEAPRDFFRALIFSGDLAPIQKAADGERRLELWLSETGFSIRPNGDAANAWSFCDRLPKSTSQGRTGFDCTFAEDPVDIMMCADRPLGELNYQLVRTLRTAESRARGASIIALHEDQANWAARRSGCWQSAERRACVEHETRDRIALLSAQFDLIPAGRQTRYRCVSWAGEWVYATPYATQPNVMKLKRGKQTELALFHAMDSSGKYIAESGVTFSLLGRDQALIEWPSHKLHRCWRR